MRGRRCWLSWYLQVCVGCVCNVGGVLFVVIFFVSVLSAGACCCLLWRCVTYRRGGSASY